MNKADLIARMREKNIKWDDIAYILETTVGSAKMIHKRSQDVLELGEKPVIKKSKFETSVILNAKKLARENPKLSIRNLIAELKKLHPGKAIPSKTTMQSILNSSGFKMIKLLNKTLIWPRNQLKRVQFCNKHKYYGPAFWDSVIWSDETTVRQRPQGKEMIVRVHSSNLDSMDMINPQIHSGGFSVMFWGCFSQLGLGPLVAIQGTMNSQNYLELLRDYVLPELNAAGQPMIFMQDNAPCHKARVVMDFLAENNIRTLNWPPQSPDMNPIENLWAIIKDQRNDKFGMAQSKQELIDQIFTIWNEIDPQIVQNLTRSANKRINLVLKLKGKISKY